MPYDPRGKVVFITGASSGIGRACAVEFHRAGAHVAVAARSLDKLQTLAAELDRPHADMGPPSGEGTGREGGPQRAGTSSPNAATAIRPGTRILPIRLDVTQLDSRLAALAAVREMLGPIDILINNAGWAAFGTVAQIPHDHVRRMLDLNLAAPIALTQAVLPEMLARGQGQIVNIASVVGLAPMPRMAVYCATKAALIEFSSALRQEVCGRGIDVIAIAPSSTATPFFDVAGTADAKATRLAETQYTPERVARAVLRASRNRRREVVLSVEGNLICLIRRFSRRFADRIMAEVAKRGMPRIDRG